MGTRPSAWLNVLGALALAWLLSMSGAPVTHSGTAVHSLPSDSLTPGSSHHASVLERPSGSMVPSGVAASQEYAVRSTLFLQNDTIVAGNPRVSSAGYPTFLAYDPGNHRVYLADRTNGVAYENATTLRDSGYLSVRLPQSAFGIAYSSSPSRLFLSDMVNRSYAVNPTTGQVLFTSTVATNPVSVVYDPSARDLFVICYATQTVGAVYIVNATTGSLVTSLSFGDQISFGAYDPESHAVAVLREGDDEMSLINDTTDRFVANVTVGNLPDGIAYDPLSHTLWVSNGNGNNVAIVNATTYAIESSISGIRDAGALAFDPSAGAMVVGQMVWGPIGLGVWPYYGISQITIANASTGVVDRTLNTTTAVGSLLYAPDRGGEVWGAMWSNNTAMAWNATTFLPLPAEPLLSSPRGLLGDPASSNVWVADTDAGRLTEIGDHPESIRQNLTLGSHPCEVTYDPVNEVVFATQNPWSNVSALNLTTGAPLPSTTALQGPEGIALDPINQEVYVADYGSGSATAIYARNDTVAASFGVGGAGPQGVLFDPVTDQVLISNSVGTLSVVNPQNNTILTHIHLGSSAQPGPMLYDPATHSLYVANRGSNNLTVLNASTYQSTASLPAGNGPEALTLNTSSGDLFIADYTFAVTSAVSVVNPVTGSLVQTLPVGIDPEGIYYDTASETVLVANAGTGSISYLGTAPILQLTSFTESAATVSVGAPVTFAIATQGGAPPLNYSQAGLPSGCLSQNAANVTCQPSVAGWYNITGFAGDSGGSLVGARVTLHVLPVLYLRSFVAHPAALDVNSTTTLYANVSYGTAPYSYQYSLLPTGCATVNSSVLSCRPTVAGNFTLHVDVTDHAGNVVQGNATVVVNPPPSITAFTANPNALWIGNTTRLSVTAKGGTGTLGYGYGGLPPGCGSLNVVSLVCTPAGSGSFNVTATVTDGTGRSSTAFTPLTVTKGPAPFTATLAPSRSFIDVGDTTYFNVTVTGGTAPFAYLYQNLPTGCGSANVSSLACTPSTAGPYASILVTVTDSTSRVATTNSVGVTVYALPGISVFSVLPSTIPLGGTTYMNVTASGGMTPYSYVYVGLPSGCTSSNTARLVCTPTSAGPYQVAVTVTDSDGKVTTSAPDTLNVTSPAGYPSITGFSVSPNPVAAGQTAQFSLTVNGGAPPYIYSYYSLPSGCTSSNTDLLNCTPTAPGNYTVRVAVSDTAGKGANATTTLQVTGVVQPLSLALSSNATTVQVGASFLLTASVGGGEGPFTYEWSLNGTNLSSAPNSPTFAPALLHPGVYTFEAWVTDALHDVAASLPVSVQAVPAATAMLASVALSPASVTVTADGTQVFEAFPDCGPVACPTGVAYLWSISDGQMGSLNITTGPSVQFTAGPNAGHVSISVTSTLGGVSRSNSTIITISPAVPPSTNGTSPPSFLGMPGFDGYLLLIGIAVAVAVGVAVVMMRRKGREATSSPAAGNSGHPGYPGYPPGQ